MFRSDLRGMKLKRQIRTIPHKCVLLFLTLTLLLSAAEDLRFFTDYARFYDPGDPYVELYYLFPRRAMTRKPQADMLQGKYLVAVNIFRGDENVYASSFAVEDYLEAEGQIPDNAYIPRIISLHLSPGTYRVHTMLRDFYSGTVIEQVQDMAVEAFTGSSPELSDIQIASEVFESDERSIFTKLNRYDVIPMANPEFDSTNGTFFSYFEIYRLETDKQYSFQSSIRDLNGNIILENAPEQRTAAGSFDAVIDYMDIRSLYAGTYSYHVLIRENESGKSAETQKNIYVVGKSKKAGAFSENMYGNFSPEETDSVFQILKSLMTYPEIRRFRRGNIAAKHQILADFWKKRDPDVSTAMNEYYYDIRERIDYAESTFGRYENGARSERGRVLLKYGYPTEVQRSGATSGTKDYEIWLYEGLRGEIKFVFCDTRGRGYYELIHSNMEGEIYNENWRAVLQSGAKNY